MLETSCGLGLEPRGLVDSTVPPSSLRSQTPGLSSPDEKLSCDPEPRSGERYIAWGVSPRIRARIKEKPRSGDRIVAPMLSAHAAARICRPLQGLVVYLPSLPWGSLSKTNPQVTLPI